MMSLGGGEGGGWVVWMRGGVVVMGAEGAIEVLFRQIGGGEALGAPPRHTRKHHNTNTTHNTTSHLHRTRRSTSARRCTPTAARRSACEAAAAAVMACVAAMR